MDFFGKLKDKVTESMLSRIIINVINNYAGEDGDDLRMGILLDVNLMKLWSENEAEAMNDGVWGIERVRELASQFPDAEQLVTAENVMKWLDKEELFYITDIIKNTAGGMLWMEQQCYSIRNMLFH